MLKLCLRFKNEKHVLNSRYRISFQFSSFEIIKASFLGILNPDKLSKILLDKIFVGK